MTNGDIAIRHPEVVRKLVLASVAYNNDGIYPEVLEAIETITSEAFAGTPWREEYDRIAPNPEDFPTLVAKLKELDLTFVGWPPEDIRAIEAPPAAHRRRLRRHPPRARRGDVSTAWRRRSRRSLGLSNSRLAVLPGTTHVGLVERSGWLVSMIGEFLDAPMPEAE